jgi:HKD family nuclease
MARAATRLRILTTTYTGATEARALDELARLPGCEVRVSLDGRRTRLHAKAWLFQRKTVSARPTWAAPTCRAQR